MKHDLTEDFLALALRLCLVLILVGIYHVTQQKRLHHCIDTPKAHQLVLIHSDSSRVLIGTMPLALSTPLILGTDDRLITGECE